MSLHASWHCWLVCFKIFHLISIIFFYYSVYTINCWSSGLATSTWTYWAAKSLLGLIAALLLPPRPLPLPVLQEEEKSINLVVFCNFYVKPTVNFKIHHYHFTPPSPIILHLLLLGMRQNVRLEVCGLCKFFVASIEWTNIRPITRMDSDVGAKVEV